MMNIIFISIIIIIVIIIIRDHSFLQQNYKPSYGICYFAVQMSQATEFRFLH